MKLGPIRIDNLLVGAEVQGVRKRGVFCIARKRCRIACGRGIGHQRLGQLVAQLRIVDGSGLDRPRTRLECHTANLAALEHHLDDFSLGSDRIVGRAASVGEFEIGHLAAGVWLRDKFRRNRRQTGGQRHRKIQRRRDREFRGLTFDGIEHLQDAVEGIFVGEVGKIRRHDLRDLDTILRYLDLSREQNSLLVLQRLEVGRRQTLQQTAP